MSVKPRLLFLSHLMPWPPHGGGQIKTWQTLNRLAQEYEITLLCFVRNDMERVHAAKLAPLCKGGIRLVPRKRGRTGDLLALANAVVTGKSWLILRDASAMMHNATCELLFANRYRTLWVDHLQMAQFIPSKTHGADVTLDEHNAEAALYAQFASLPTLPLLVRALWRAESSWLQKFETMACLRADSIHAVSHEDADTLALLHRDIGKKTIVTPILPPRDLHKPVLRNPNSKNLLFVGTLDWPPNSDGLLWFVQEIWPAILRAVPDATFTVVGTRAGRNRAPIGSDSGRPLHRIRGRFDAVCTGICRLHCAFTGGRRRSCQDSDRAGLGASCRDNPYRCGGIVQKQRCETINNSPHVRRDNKRLC